MPKINLEELGITQKTIDTYSSAALGLSSTQKDSEEFASPSPEIETDDSALELWSDPAWRRKAREAKKKKPRQPTVQFTESEDRALKRFVEEDVVLTDIPYGMRLLGFKPRTYDAYWKRLNRLGLSFRRSPGNRKYSSMEEGELEAAKELHKQGKFYREIAETLVHRGFPKRSLHFYYKYLRNVPRNVEHKKNLTRCMTISNHRFKKVKSPAKGRDFLNLRIGENIEKLRVKKNFTQKHLASLIGVSHQTIGRWERGLGDFYWKRLVELARILEVSVQDITGDKRHGII